jgi:hypothetical protein
MLMNLPRQDRRCVNARAREHTQMPIKIVGAASAAVKASGFHLNDLSGVGASLLGLVSLGPLGGCIRLVFDYTPQTTNEEVHAVQNARIQSLEEVPKGKNRYFAPVSTWLAVLQGMPADGVAGV